MSNSATFDFQAALAKFGEYTTDDLVKKAIEAVVNSPNAPIEQVVHEAALCAIINGDIYAAPRTTGFLQLADIVKAVTKETLDTNEPLTEENSILWTRNGNQIARERLGIWETAAVRFVEYLCDKNNWVAEYIGGDNIAHLHPYVQARLLDRATMVAAQNAVDYAGMKWTATVTVDEQGNFHLVKTK